MVNLLPCPFCGGEAKVIEDSMLICGHRYWRIIHNSNDCPITDAFGIFRSSAKYSTAEKAISAWNRRTDHIRDTTKKVSNADRIRGMSDEELAKWMALLKGDTVGGSAKFILDWLQQPAKEEHHDAD